MLIARAATALFSMIVFAINGGMSTSPADPIPTCSFQVVGHRGTDTGVARNNTVAAFAQAVDAGADVVEMDLRLTAPDSEGRRTWVVNHDEKIRGHEISGTTFRLLRDLQPDLATFSGAARAVAAAGVRIEVELKPERVATDRLREVLAVLTAEGLRDGAVLTSAHRSVLAELEPLAGPTQLGIIMRKADSPAALKKVADRVLIRHSLITADFVRAAHAHGLAVEVWTVDDADGWRTVSRLGVDGIITDKAAAVTAWCVGSAAVATS